MNEPLVESLPMYVVAPEFARPRYAAEPVLVNNPIVVVAPEFTDNL
jgi:hypothetical protein